MIEHLIEISRQAASRRLQDWWAYSCDNGTQDLDRLSFYFGDKYEVQINRIRHSKGPHCHGCDMMSLILVNGYGWWLQQYGSQKPIYLFSGRGSLITMQPEDTHWIPETEVPSVSLCVFNKQSDWHKHYCEHSPLCKPEASSLLLSAQSVIRSLLESDIQIATESFLRS